MTHTQEQHSPLTMKYSREWGWCVMDGEQYFAWRLKSEERAALIVRAVNCHEELVEALRAMLSGAPDCDHIARAAIAREESR